MQQAKAAALQGQLPPLASANTCEVDLEELARRTGHKHEHILAKVDLLAHRAYLAQKSKGIYNATIKKLYEIPKILPQKKVEQKVPEHWNCIKTETVSVASFV